jgi:Uma2 family endonuclease
MSTQGWPWGVTPPPRGEDLPYDDGEPMETPRHRDQMVLLIDTLKRAWSHRDDFYVGGNEFVYFSQLQAKHNDFRGPDVYVVLDPVIKKERKSWVVWEEGGRTPDVIIELLSPGSEATDRGEKMRIYSRVLRVAEYFLFDPWDGRLEGYRLDSLRGSYEPMQTDERGWLRSERLGLRLGKVHAAQGGIEADWLRWIDDDGSTLPTDEERQREAEAGAQAAKDEAQAAKDEAQAAKDEAQAAKDEAQAVKDEAQAAQEQARQKLQAAGHKLVESGMSARDVAELLGVDESLIR